jgi:dTDP-4-amino-4,6-dideoxygalactose transaminase
MDETAKSQIAERGIAVASGTAGLAVALQMLTPRGVWVGTPSTICPSVVAAILAAGCRPWFIDIERETLGIDPDALRPILSELGAVIAVHSMGEPCRIEEIATLAAAAGVPLIEDCAQADGVALPDGRSVGSFGDVAVFSYGAGKILDIGGGGLLVARDDGLHARLRNAVEQLRVGGTDAAHAAASNLGTTYKSLYNTGYPHALSAHQERFLSMLEAAGQAALVQAERKRHAEIIDARRTRLAATVVSRRRKRDHYIARLAGRPEISIVPFSAGSVPWRFNILLPPAERDDVLRGMLAARRNVSSWSPDISPFLPRRAYRATPLENAAWLSERILNLWLDDATSPDEIDATCDWIISRVGRTR